MIFCVIWSGARKFTSPPTDTHTHKMIVCQQRCRAWRGLEPTARRMWLPPVGGGGSCSTMSRSRRGRMGRRRTDRPAPRSPTPPTVPGENVTQSFFCATKKQREHVCTVSKAFLSLPWSRVFWHCEATLKGTTTEMQLTRNNVCHVCLSQTRREGAAPAPEGAGHRKPDAAQPREEPDHDATEPDEAGGAVSQDAQGQPVRRTAAAQQTKQNNVILVFSLRNVTIVMWTDLHACKSCLCLFVLQQWTLQSRDLSACSVLQCELLVAACRSQFFFQQ